MTESTSHIGVLSRGRAARRQGGRTARRPGGKVVSVGLLLLVGVVSSACKGKDDDAAKPDDPNVADSTAQAAAGSVTLPVVGQGVRQGDLVLSVVTTGQVRSDGVAVLKSETTGPIIAVKVRPGDRVARGTPLVEVDPRELDLAVAQQQASLEDAKLKLLDLTLGDSIITGKR